ncbi:MAG: hypothetical protein Q9180_006897, partial [Flavoplaca navasiana]
GSEKDRQVICTQQKEEIKRLSERADDLKQLCNKQACELLELRASVTTSVKEIVNLKEAVETSTARLKQEETRTRRSAHQIETLTGNINDLRSKAQKAQADLTTAHNAGIQKLTQVASDAKQKLTSLAQHHDQLKIQLSEATGKADEHKLAATKAKEAGRKWYHEYSSANSRLESMHSAAAHSKSVFEKQLHACRVSSKASVEEIEQLRQKLELSRLEDGRSKSRISGLEIQARSEREAMLADMRILLGIDHGLPSSTLTRLAIPQDLKLPSRVTPYSGCLDPQSMINGKYLTPLSSCTAPTTEGITCREDLLFAISMQVIKMVLCLDQEDAMDQAVDILWNIWGNLETNVISPTQISHIASPLAGLIDRVVTCTLQEKHRNLTCWLAIGLLDYLSNWGFSDLHMATSSIEQDPQRHDDCTMAFAVRSCLIKKVLRMQPDEQALMTSSYQLLSGIDQSPAVFINFAAEFNGQIINASVSHLAQASEVLWVLQPEGGRSLLWHGKATSCTIITYKITFYICLSRGETEKPLWLWPVSDVREWLVNKFAVGTIRSEDEGLLASLFDRTKSRR